MKVLDPLAAQERLQRRRHVAHRHAEVLGAVPVERDGQLRLVDPHVAVHVDQAGDLPRPLDQRVHRFGQLVEVRMLDHELHRLPEPAERGRIVGERQHAGDLRQLGLELLDDLLGGALPVRPVREPREQEPAVHPATHRDHAVEHRDLGRVEHQPLRLPLVLVGVGHRGPLGGRDGHHEAPPVLRRHEFPLEALERR